MLSFLLSVFLPWLCFYAFSYGAYLLFNKGLSKQARHLQARRFFFASVLAFLPVALFNAPLSQPSILLIFFISALWIVAHVGIHHWLCRKSQSGYDRFFDITFGIYLFGVLSSLSVINTYFLDSSILGAVIIGILEFIVAFLPVYEVVYFLLYQSAVDEDSLQAIQETHYNEIIEFFRSFSLPVALSVVLVPLALLVGCCLLNVIYPVNTDASVNFVKVLVLFIYLIFSLSYLFKPKKGLLFRTDIVALYLDVRDYRQKNSLYNENLSQRLSALQVTPLAPAFSKPSTIIMVIGESAARDYMSAFTSLPVEDTPWLSAAKEDSSHFILYPNAYSCATQTVPALERALTEFNQYNNKPFFESVSLIDIAHKAGYHVHWYSNQGHLGAADTSVTLVADTADVTKWTSQELDKVSYDSSLVSFLDEVDPTRNNFVVLHLKGSHFNYMNRYPASFSKFGEPGVQDEVLNYENSIAYTDSILKQFYEYGRNKLNLQAMVYFSDHGTYPTKRRSAAFKGFGMVRIPMFTWFSDEYISLHPQRYNALLQHRDSFYTNDLAYELMCGIFDVQSNHFVVENSLAYQDYKYQRDDLLTDSGRVRVNLDNGKDDYKM